MAPQFPRSQRMAYIALPIIGRIGCLAIGAIFTCAVFKLEFFDSRKKNPRCSLGGRCILHPRRPGQSDYLPRDYWPPSVFAKTDEKIFMGTSLTVAPANSLVYRVPPTALRMVMNDERVGRRLGIDCSEDAIRDVWARGRTDATCLDLAERMGWLDDLAAIADELPDSLAKLLRDRLDRRSREEEGACS